MLAVMQWMLFMAYQGTALMVQQVERARSLGLKCAKLSCYSQFERNNSAGPLPHGIVEDKNVLADLELVYSDEAVKTKKKSH